jgi:hypothetical protein
VTLTPTALSVSFPSSEGGVVRKRSQKMLNEGKAKELNKKLRKKKAKETKRIFTWLLY